MRSRFAFHCTLRLILNLAFAVLALLMSSHANAQSFNCRYAKSPDEVLICHNTRLAHLDEQMASIFFSVRNRLPGSQQAALVAQQQSWLRARMSCGSDANCVAAAYAQRIDQLTALAGVQQQTSANSSIECRVMDPTGTPLNVRTSPDGNIVGTVSNGVRVIILDHTLRRGKDWVYVGKAEDRVPIGWVFESYLDCAIKTTVQAPSNAGQPQENSYWFVANTEPPDAYLALRTAPSSQGGQRIAMMPNGTMLQVLERRPDRWWLVRVVGTGAQGWALSGQGDRVWIECCQNAGGSQVAASRAATTEHNSNASSEESSGTGFFVAAHLVLTNNHVIKGCGEYPINVSYPDRRPVRAYIAGQDDTNDLVLLQTDLPNESIASFRFGPRVGEQVAAYGYPLLGLLSTSGNFTLGNITALAGMKDDTRLLQTSTPVQPGNSGGPLLDMSGSVVGVVEAQLDALTMIKVASDVPQNVNFAIQTPIVINFLSVKGVSPSLAGSEHKTLDPSDVAKLAQSFTVQIMCQPTGN